MQNQYNLLRRQDERELMAMCADMGVGLVPYPPKLRPRDNHKLRPTLAGHLGARRCRPRQRGVRRHAAAAVRLDRRLP
jgi:aryl-alcohol dehydrogenase-like predicted oxidoreductase